MAFFLQNTHRVTHSFNLGDNQRGDLATVHIGGRLISSVAMVSYVSLLAK